MVERRKAVAVLLVGVLLLGVFQPWAAFAADATVVGQLPSARNCTASALADNGKIYIFGGWVGDTNTSAIVEFDPVMKTTHTVGNLPVKLHDASAVAANGKIYVFGGKLYFGVGSTDAIPDIFEFDPETKTVIKVGEFSTSRYGVGAALAGDDKIYVFGGQSGEDGDWEELDEIVSYDPATHGLSVVGGLPVASEGYVAVGLENGNICVLAGAEASIYEFDYQTKTITTVSSLQNRLIETTAALSCAGRVYVFGGHIPLGPSISDICVIDPSNWTSAKIGQLSSACRCMSSAPTSDGKIYVFGGTLSTGAITSQILEYNPLDPPIPVSLSYTQVRKTISLTWTGGENAQCYYVDRSLNGQDFTNVGETTDKTFTDQVTEPRIYYYHVRAVNDLGTRTSNVVSVTVAPTAPLLTAAWDANKLTVTYDPGDTPPDGEVHLYRRDSIVQKWIGLGIYNDGAEPFVIDDSYTIPGQGYQYALRQDGGLGGDYEWQTVCESEWAYGGPQPAPAGLHIASLTDTGATVSWDSLSGVTSYTVETSTDGETWTTQTVSGTTTTVPRVCQVRIKAGSSARSQWSGVLTVP